MVVVVVVVVVVVKVVIFENFGFWKILILRNFEKFNFCKILNFWKNPMQSYQSNNFTIINLLIIPLLLLVIPLLYYL